MAARKGGALIRPIDKAAVHRICSGQVVLDLATAVKELVENSLDAGATSIEIKLKEYGAESFEVADNGCGVSSENYQALTLKYHTSKISEFADLQSLSSFGFRGEALSSLCALAHVSIVTRTKDEPVATQLNYDHSGLIISQKSEARPVGTTVTVSKLFSPLPVRHKEFNRNIRREYSRLLSVLHAYALIAKGVRFVCTNLSGKNKTVILKTQGTSSVKDNIITVFGTKTAACLDPLDLCVGDECQIEGFISKPGSGSGRGSGDRQFFYINGRPVDIPKFGKLLNDLYRSFNSQQYPMAVLNFFLPTTAYDVNVTPDKRKVFLHAENALMTALKESLEKVYAPDKYTYAVHNLESSVLEKGSSLARELPEFETQNSLNDVDEDNDALGTIQAKEGQVDDNQDPYDSVVDGSAVDRPMVEAICIDNGGAAAGEKHSNCTAPSADLDSFQCITSSTSTKFTSISASRERHSEVGAGLGEKIASTVHQKVIQSKLTGFVSQTKRQLEDGALLSEEPLLKKWMFAAAADSRKGSLDRSATNGLKPCTSSTRLFMPRTEDATLNSDKVCEGETTSCCDGQNEHINSTKERTVVSKIKDGKAVMDGEDAKDHSSRLQFTSLAVVSDSSGSLAPILDQETADNVHFTSVNKSESCAADAVAMSTDSSTVGFDLDKLRSRLKKGLLRYEYSSAISRRQKTLKKRRFFTAASMSFDGTTKGGSEKEEALAAATRELEKTFNKADFKHMKVIGQFNLGFILAKLNGDLFIIDQHASDEKYNFERLSKSTVLNRQPLLRPLPLELSAAEEVVVSMHIETFRQNGFDFAEFKEAHPGQRLRLSAVPLSKNITFGIEDVQELVSLLADEPTFCGVTSDETNGVEDMCAVGNQERTLSSIRSLVRPSRVRAMLASRACRSSIMIGDALSKKEMERILFHLAQLDAPWNCPHGRPTMRHLADLATIKRCQ